MKKIDVTFEKGTSSFQNILGNSMIKYFCLNYLLVSAQAIMAQVCSPFCSFRAEITQKESRELLCIQIRAAEVKPVFLPFHRQSNFWSHWKHRGFVTGLNRADKSPSAQSGDFFHQSQGSYETQDILLNKISFSAKSFVEYFRQIEMFQWEISTQKILEL